MADSLQPRLYGENDVGNVSIYLLNCGKLNQILNEKINIRGVFDRNLLIGRKKKFFVIDFLKKRCLPKLFEKRLTKNFYGFRILLIRPF